MYFSNSNLLLILNIFNFNFLPSLFSVVYTGRNDHQKLFPVYEHN